MIMVASSQSGKPTHRLYDIGRFFQSLLARIALYVIVAKVFGRLQINLLTTALQGDNVEEAKLWKTKFELCVFERSLTHTNIFFKGVRK